MYIGSIDEKSSFDYNSVFGFNETLKKKIAIIKTLMRPLSVV